MNRARVRVRVWDGPTRLVHWSIVGLVALSWWTAERGELHIHRYSGYTLFGVLVFRVYWGLVGSETARLFRYLRGPRAAFGHARKLFARGASGLTLGHNALGAWSALAMFTLLIVQITLGTFAVDVDGIESGPLSHLVSFEVGRDLAAWHERVFDALLAFIAVHIAAVLFYTLIRRENLLTVMLTGSREVQEQPQAAPAFASWRRAWPGLAAAGLAVWALSAGFWT